MNGLWPTQRVGESPAWTWAICWLRSDWMMRAKPKYGYLYLILNPPTKRGTITRQFASCLTGRESVTLPSIL